MKFRYLKILAFTTAFAAGLFSDCLLAEDIILITNSANAIDHLEIREVRAIFSMRLKTWPNNQAIQVFVLEQNHPIHELFCKNILKVFPHQLQAGWDRLVFSGTGEAPKIVNSEEKMIAAVRSTPGSIGYISISYSLKQENAHENVKTINIE